MIILINNNNYPNIRMIVPILYLLFTKYIIYYKTSVTNRRSIDDKVNNNAVNNEIDIFILD